MAKKTPLTNLYKNLTSAPPVIHIGEEKLLEMASAESAGEDIALRYAEETQHMEYCLQCASAYSEVMELLLDMESVMASAAEAVAPADVFQALLGVPLADLADTAFVEAFVAQLPLAFAEFPAGITPDQIQQIANQTNHADQLTPNHIDTLTQTLQQNLTALHLYLQGQANKVWQQGVKYTTEVVGQWGRITLAPVPPKAVATLSGQEIGDHRLLFSRTRDRLLRLNIDADITRQSELACKLEVRADRPGLRKVAGREIVVTYNNQPHTATTNENGIAAFDAVPIAALPHLQVDIG